MRRPVQVQHIELHFSRLRMVLTPPFCERFGRWCVDGWGDARIYSYYILIWIYRLEHLISIRVDGLDVAMLDAALGFAPLIHLKTAHLAFDSRCTWHAPLFHVAYASPPATCGTGILWTSSGYSGSRRTCSSSTTTGRRAGASLTFARADR